MDDDILFLVDELQEQNTRELKQIMFLLQHPTLQKDAYVLRKFTKALLYASAHKQVQQPAIQQPFARVAVLPGKLQITKLQPASAAEYHPSIPKAPEQSQMQNIPPQPEMIPPFPEPPSIASAFPQLGEPGRTYTLVADKRTQKSLATVDVGTQYTIHEPELFEPDKQLLHRVREELKRKEVHGDALLDVIKKQARKLHLPEAEELITKIKYYAMRDSRLGKIEPILRDKYVEKVICNSPKDCVKVIYLHQELQTNVRFAPDEMQEFVEELIQKTNPKLDRKANMFDYAVGNLRIQVQRATKLTSPKFTITKLKV
ncbi:MAG TPA: hypothetical protein VJJ75_01270 [Candidatus Nanoarchaeia archaeon]|nr:hypothetical protein [Candidatus Nanoarchaeia archaeon]